jgi:hypothetical protein
MFDDRTQRNGTLLHIVGSGDKFVRISVQGKKVAVEVPETESISTSLVGKRANDGKWHTVSLLFFASSGSTVVD